VGGVGGRQCMKDCKAQEVMNKLQR